MENPIPASCLNDYVFCPVSIYFHRLYGNMDNRTYQRTSQTNGSHAHSASDEKRYSTKRNIIMALDAYSEEYNIVCKIDVFYADDKLLVERKKKIVRIYDGYVFQMYGQYFAMSEMGYEIKKLQLYSMEDNKKYDVPLPENSPEMFIKFKKIIADIMNFNMETFVQTNAEKCKNCIYEPSCDRAIEIEE